MANVLFGSEAADFVTRTHGPEIRIREGGQPIAFNRDTDLAGVPEHMHPWARRWNPVLRNESAFVANSFLLKEEWASLDQTIYSMVKLRRNAIATLRSRGLVTTSSLNEMVSRWRVSTERTRPSVTMDGRTAVDRDRTDRKTYGTPMPIIRADYELGRRELLASRAVGAPLDTQEAAEAAESVSEELERIFFDGADSVVVQGYSIDGVTSHSSRLTDTASNYGGGDFGTISNIKSTVLGMLSALAAIRYHGPFVGWVAQTQYAQMLETYTDGTGQTALQRCMELPQIDDILPSDILSAGEFVLVQMTPNVVDLREAMGIENREWMSGDEMALYFAVMTAAVPRLKVDAAGNLGICHATSC